MLVVPVQMLYGRLGAVLSALIVVSCVVGLTMHRDFYAGTSRKDFFCFYTNLSNLAVLVYFALLSPYFYASASLRPLISHAEFLIMMSIMLTFCVFHLILYPAIQGAVSHAEHTREFYIAYADNLILHYLVPWLVFFYWIFCAPDKAELTMADAFIWTLFPIAYLLSIFFRAKQGLIIQETGTPYPYPFLDIRALGKKTVLRTCLFLYLICLTAGISLLLTLRFFLLLFGDGHTLFLI